MSKYKGKVSLIVNVTANCGNAPQLGILEKIYNKYKDQGFEIIAIPTNDYCGPGVPYDEGENGITCADDARTYALDTYQVTFDFSELVTSNVDDLWREKRNNHREVHPLFEALTTRTMGGNFEKFLVDRDGRLVERFANFMLLDFYYENIKDGLLELSENDIPPIRSDEAYDLICSAIEKIL